MKYVYIIIIMLFMTLFEAYLSVFRVTAIMAKVLKNSLTVIDMKEISKTADTTEKEPFSMLTEINMSVILLMG